MGSKEPEKKLELSDLGSAMSNQINHSLPYPAGYIRYAFMMHAAYDQNITCNIGHSNVTEIVFYKTITPTAPLGAEWHMTIHVGAVFSIEEVQQIGSAISDNIFDIVSLVLNTRISEVRLVNKGLTPRAGEGAIMHLLAPPPQLTATCSSGDYPLSGTDIQNIQDALTRTSSLKKKSLLRLFRIAVGADEPLVQFLILYLTLEILHNGSQFKIDKFIMSDSPNTSQTPDPRKEKNEDLETVYTRLRNEIAHRDSFALDTTGAEIRNCIDEFQKIVNEAVKKCI